MLKFIIERNIPGIGHLATEELEEGAAKSSEALAALAPDVQWLHSYITENQAFCVYLAKDEDVIRRHAELSGFPANRIIEVGKVITPTDAK